MTIAYGPRAEGTEVWGSEVVVGNTFSTDPAHESLFFLLACDLLPGENEVYCMEFLKGLKSELKSMERVESPVSLVALPFWTCP